MASNVPTPRERFETEHVRLLGPYAVTEAASGGRADPEPPHYYRTCFQRDRDRIVHCSAFRRLDFKTQVFVPHEHDHFRTRLTHTLEVAQIGRTLGRTLRLNEDLIEAVALAHDLGHPPFGHGGEDVLNELMAGHGHFEHNRQSLRVVDYLEHPYPGFRGLNLTRVVRQCIAKHQTRYDSPACPEFDANTPAPLEGQLVDLADEIAYVSADLEDALAAEWIKIEQLSGLKLWQQAWQAAKADAPNARMIHKRVRACKAVLAAMADDLLRTTEANIQELNADSLLAAQKAPRRIVAFSQPMAEAVRQMQEFLLERVYLHSANAEQDRRAGRIVRELFAAYLADTKLLPKRYQARIEADSLHRVVCDYVAGMTDRFCTMEHKRICGCCSSQ
ncbi:MAG: deoxyguanosinetriphosphate triphosphohydrolase [Planctomycetota bacterium]|nr:deoxyguanosinetriphosphate triphosphohydrolase [Planctomycetota bacterium]